MVPPQAKAATVAGVRACVTRRAPLRSARPPFAPVAPRTRHHVRTAARAASIETALPSVDWAALSAAEQAQLEGYTLRPGQVPSSSPTAQQLPTTPDVESTKRVLLYRDTNAWCPFCERVWFALLEKGIEFDTVFIDLGAKPEWYLEMVPTGMVPAARIDGDLVYESADILAKLEAAYPSPPLLPASDDPLAERAKELLDACDNAGIGGAGYTYLAGRRLGASAEEEQPSLEELRAAFEAKLGEMEAALGEHPGPFFLPELSMVDIMYTPPLMRLAANMPGLRGFSLTDNPSFPRVGAWVEAISARPSYAAISSDPDTLRLLFGKVFGMRAAAEATPGADALEAGAKLSANHAAVVADVLKNSGLGSGEGDYTESAVEVAVYNLAAGLLGKPLQQAEVPEDASKEEKQAAQRRLAAVAAASLAFLRNRVSAPRDMSAAAAAAFRAEADRQLTALYA